MVKSLGYGDLEKLLVIDLPHDAFLADFSGQRVVLALITPWNTNGEDASKENVYMTTRKGSFITDVRVIQRVVGVVETRGKWGIIDRTMQSTMKADDIDSDDDIF